MSSLAPVPPPESGGIDTGEVEPPPSPPAPSPENDDASPLLAPVVQIPLPPSPPESSSIIPSPLAAPPLPLVVVGPTPPLLSPVSSPLRPQPQPPPPQPPQPPLTSPPPPPNQKIPPQKKPTPPSISPPVNKPINITPPTPTSKASPTPTTTASPSPPLEQPPQPPPRPPTRRPRTAPDTKPSPSKPGPSHPGPSSPKTIPLTPPPPSSLPTSAILPSPPPMALPVPQAPDGGTWLPFTSETPLSLPSLPGPPRVINSPAAPLLGNPSGASASSALVPSSGADHQNIEADVSTSGRSSTTGSSAFVLGLCVGGVLLVFLGVVLAILGFFCRRREKKFDDYGSGSKHGAAFSGFADKTSLPQSTKQGSNTQGGHQVLVNVTTPQRPTTTTNGSSHGGVATMVSGGTFTYEELAGATNWFSDRNLLGQGGFGYVHKGVLPNGKEVAVKQLKMGGQQGEREFQAEVETISLVHHKHLVSLVGYCIAGAERLLVYEFVPNDTLEFHLHGKGQPVMDWPTRLRIAIGSGKGLAYLHEDCSPMIIHRDIKAANILLDFNFEAKVSDFGLAKIFTSTNSSVIHITTRVVGTFGYLAPEYASSGKVTDKSDVYSYGVMLLELITGRPPICNSESATNGSLVNWARPLLAQAIGDGNYNNVADPRLQNNYNVDEMANMVACAAACVRLSAWRRPRMSQVIRALEGNLSPTELDDGIRAGHNSMHFPYESLDFDVQHYIEDLKRMELTSNNGYSTTSRYNDNTSEYGLQPSTSSTDTSQQRSQRG